MLELNSFLLAEGNRRVLIKGLNTLPAMRPCEDNIIGV